MTTLVIDPQTGRRYKLQRILSTGRETRVQAQDPEGNTLIRPLSGVWLHTEQEGEQR